MELFCMITQQDILNLLNRLHDATSSWQAKQIAIDYFEPFVNTGIGRRIIEAWRTALVEFQQLVNARPQGWIYYEPYPNNQLLTNLVGYVNRI
jgi:hypothetical protein